jgi:hypothetical protein
MKEFERAIKEQDFSEGDEFWINGVEFRVIDKRSFGNCLNCGKQEDFCECEK